MGRKRRKMCENATGSSGESSELDTDSDRPSQCNSANNRERARMRVLSAAFGRLKNTLPWVPQDTKLSKLDTLRMASCYIANLAELLAQETGDLGHDDSDTVRPAARLKLRRGFHRPVSLAWPYSLVNRGTSDSVENNHSFNAAKACARFIGDKAVSCVD